MLLITFTSDNFVLHIKIKLSIFCLWYAMLSLYCLVRVSNYPQYWGEYQVFHGSQQIFKSEVSPPLCAYWYHTRCQIWGDNIHWGQGSRFHNTQQDCITIHIISSQYYHNTYNIITVLSQYMQYYHNTYSIIIMHTVLSQYIQYHHNA